jgi:hypothetical protein
MQSTNVPHPFDAEYEDLLSLWSDLEAGVGMVLRKARLIPDLPRKIRQYDRWMQDMLRQDTDTGLYLLFQLASNSSLGYSSSHALICAVLCNIIAQDVPLPPGERDSLIAAAMTMNVAMTELQNELAEQADKPTPQQQAGIQTHALEGRLLLEETGVADPLWLDVVEIHHDVEPSEEDLFSLEPAQRLARILHVVDRYAAMISPRKTRAGRTVTESVRTMMTRADGLRDQVAFALVRAVGLCPPGTYVRMDTGETAVVLRRGSKANHPMVATVLNRMGDKLSSPRLHRTAMGGPAIQSALTHEMVRQRVRINHQNLLRLGFQAERVHKDS